MENQAYFRPRNLKHQVKNPLHSLSLGRKRPWVVDRMSLGPR